MEVLPKTSNPGYLRQGGTAYIFGSNGALLRSHAIDGPDVAYFLNNGKIGRAIYDMDALKQFIAIVAGESSDNYAEATAIAQVMMNRMRARDTDLVSGFVDKIGGAGQYDAIDDVHYNTVMQSSFADIFSSDFSYAVRVMGAMQALNGGLDYSGGAYFWSATSGQNNPPNNSPWAYYNAGIFNITTSWGRSTFFKYADGRTWP